MLELSYGVPAWEDGHWAEDARLEGHDEDACLQEKLVADGDWPLTEARSRSGQRQRASVGKATGPKVRPGPSFLRTL